MKWLLFVSLTSWFYVLFVWATSHRMRVMSRMAAITVDKQPQSHSPHGEKAGGQRNSLRVVLRKFSTGWAKQQSTASIEKVQHKLAQAGNPFNLSVGEWIGLRFSFAGAGAILGLVMLSVASFGLSGFALALCCLLTGWIGPEFWLSRRVTLRQTELMRQLPSALDLLTVSVEAGLGFDQAIARVAQKMKGPLPEEFSRVLREIQLGSMRAAALQRLAERCALDAVKTFVSAVIQADKLGVGMAQVLRVQSAEVRRKRRLDAEERAMKAPVKMLFPLVLFVFPALFIVILGPAALHMLQVFGHGGIN